MNVGERLVFYALFYLINRECDYPRDYLNTALLNFNYVVNKYRIIGFVEPLDGYFVLTDIGCPVKGYRISFDINTLNLEIFIGCEDIVLT